jgi:hypothetical protein
MKVIDAGQAVRPDYWRALDGYVVAAVCCCRSIELLVHKRQERVGLVGRVLCRGGADLGQRVRHAASPADEISAALSASGQIPR